MMQKVRAVAAVKPPWLILEQHFNGGLYSKLRNVGWQRRLPSALPTTTSFRSMHFSRITGAFASTENTKWSFLGLLRRLGFPEPGKYKRQLTGYLLYEDIASNVNYSDFFKDFKLPDTFFSWFVVMELHVWMLMARYMAEGKPGREIRNSIVEAMWADVNARKSKLKNANVSALKSQITELSHQFNAAIIGYDEGIMSDDKVLAGALWRRLFQCEGNNPLHVEKLVAYVRKQMDELDRMPSEECMSKNSIEWIRYGSS